MAALALLGIPQIYLQELLYRGFAITFIERATGSIVAAVAISSAAFALAHITSLGGNLAVSLASVFAVSVLLSILYTATRDVSPVFVLHWAWVAWLAVGLSRHAQP
jgi:membrane protease YdiL (CAAX protease family)